MRRPVLTGVLNSVATPIVETPTAFRGRRGRDKLVNVRLTELVLWNGVRDPTGGFQSCSSGLPFVDRVGFFV